MTLEQEFGKIRVSDERETMANQIEIDAKWWRTMNGTKWHLLRIPGNGVAPGWTVCGISEWKLIDGQLLRPEWHVCQKCALDGVA